MPLHADAEAVARRLDALDHAVGRGGVDHDAGRRVGRRLVMGAVHRSSSAPTMPCSCVPCATFTAWPGSLRGLGCSCASALGDRVGDVLDQLAAQHDVQQLLAAADAQHRLVAVERALGDGELEGGAAVLGDDRRVPRAAAVVGRIDVEGAAGHDQRVDALEIVGRRGRARAAGRPRRPPAASMASR